MYRFSNDIMDRAKRRAAEMDALFAGIFAPCCSGDDGSGCICNLAERVLRAYAAGQTLPVMSTEQRNFCLEQIDETEGYERADYEQSTDKELAAGVLSAWLDYVRDKGLL
jgi:hypothetical protein